MRADENASLAIVPGSLLLRRRIATGWYGQRVRPTRSAVASRTMLAMSADWKTIDDLEDHFRRHGRAVGARTIGQYAELALLTVREDVRFQYRLGARRRVGRYHIRRGLFVALEEGE